jgi:O-antigen/teichoic acid export membrane protein
MMMKMKYYQKIKELMKKIFSNKIISNSLWGVFANIFQNLFLSVFFVIMARVYNEKDLASYIIANTIYSFVLGFSSLGLGYWFIREYINTEFKEQLVEKFFKIQLVIGLVFYIINILFTLLFYDNQLIIELSFILGINIVFDNIIYVIKYLNIAEHQQKKSAILLNVEAFIKCMFALFLFFYFIDVKWLSVILIVIRLLSLNLFIRYGSSRSIHLKSIFKTKLQFQEIKRIILENYSFVIIGSISIINLRVGNLVVSKYLSLNNVSYYEISFKLLSLVYIIPVIIGGSIYPVFLKMYKQDVLKVKNYFYNIYLLFAVFGFFCFTMIFSFSKLIIPLLFGQKYAMIYPYCSQMFLVMLVLPTLLLQANLLVVMGLEKIDMICNLVCLASNILFCFIGLKYFHSLSVVIYALCFSFFVFHLIQDYVLVRKGMITISKAIWFYTISFVALVFYYFMSNQFGGILFFFLFWFVILLIAIVNRKKIFANLNVQYESVDINS